MWEGNVSQGSVQVCEKLSELLLFPEELDGTVAARFY